MPAEKKLVLAYSGGLDTSVAIRWLKDKGWDVIAFTVDLGEKKDLDAIQARALKIGASAAYVADGRLPFLRLFVWPSLQAGAVYEKEYPLATALGRPLIAAMMVEVARREGALAMDAPARATTRCASTSRPRRWRLTSRSWRLCVSGA
jgi:argininosuccinate synthase